MAKEAFHAWQGIASVFYDKAQCNHMESCTKFANRDEDRQIADTAWREYLLSEAALKDLAFALQRTFSSAFRFWKDYEPCSSVRTAPAAPFDWGGWPAWPHGCRQ